MRVRQTVRKSPPTFAGFVDRGGDGGPGNAGTLRSQQGKDTDLILQPPERNTVSATLDFSPVRLISGFWPPQL